MTKKVWKTPELIVMVRSKPEEAVLANCKNNSGTPGGPTGTGCLQGLTMCQLNANT